MNAERLYVNALMTRLGMPYLWAAKGDFAVRSGCVVGIATLGAKWGTDCSGLIAWGIKACGGPDLRNYWSADAMRAHLPEPERDETVRLVVYGANGHASHVALELGDSGIVIEAAGGDETTLDAADALARHACVMLGPETHHNRLGVRSLRALFAAPIIPPTGAP